MRIRKEKSINLLHYGLQRSGTNFLESIIKKNYKVQFLNSKEYRSSPLHKHCRLYRDKEIIPEPQYNNEIVVESFEQFESLFKITPDYYLVISKDPYSWYLSYRNWAKKCKWPDVNHHYIEEYNLFYKTFIDFSYQSDKFIFVRYTDLLKDTESVLDTLAKQIKLKKRMFSKLMLRNPRKVPQSAALMDKKRAYYLNQEYLKEYNADDIQTLNRLLDVQVAAFLGYESSVAVD